MNDLKFECPHCKQRLEADDGMRDLIVACPVCKKELELSNLLKATTAAEHTTHMSDTEYGQLVDDLLRNICSAGESWSGVAGDIVLASGFIAVPLCFFSLWLLIGIRMVHAFGWALGLLILMFLISLAVIHRGDTIYNRAIRKAGELFDAQFPEGSIERVRAITFVSSKVKRLTAEYDAEIKEIKKGGIPEVRNADGLLHGAPVLWEELYRKGIVPDDEYKQVSDLYNEYCQASIQYLGGSNEEEQIPRSDPECDSNHPKTETVEVVEYDLATAIVLGALQEEGQQVLPDVTTAADSSEVEWYARESSAKMCKQIIIAEKKVSICKSPIEGPFIYGPLQRCRAWGMATVYSDNIPYLCIKCVGIEEAIKSVPCRLAFSFYRFSEAGLFLPLLEIPHDKHKPFVVENPWNLGESDFLRVARDLLSRSYLVLQFFDTNLIGVHARVVKPPVDCLMQIRSLFEEAFKYNAAISGADFRAAENRYYDMNPPDESPILANVRTERKQRGTAKQAFLCNADKPRASVTDNKETAMWNCPQCDESLIGEIFSKCPKCGAARLGDRHEVPAPPKKKAPTRHRKKAMPPPQRILKGTIDDDPPLQLLYIEENKYYPVAPVEVMAVLCDANFPESLWETVAESVVEVDKYAPCGSVLRKCKVTYHNATSDKNAMELVCRESASRNLNAIVINIFEGTALAATFSFLLAVLTTTPPGKNKYMINAGDRASEVLKMRGKYAEGEGRVTELEADATQKLPKALRDSSSRTSLDDSSLREAERRVVEMIGDADARAADPLVALVADRGSTWWHEDPLPEAVADTVEDLFTPEGSNYIADSLLQSLTDRVKKSHGCTIHGYPPDSHGSGYECPVKWAVDLLDYVLCECEFSKKSESALRELTLLPDTVEVTYLRASDADQDISVVQGIDCKTIKEYAESRLAFILNFREL